MMLKIFLLFGLIDYISTIQCYMCTGSGNYCPAHLNFDGGDESNEQDIVTAPYGPNDVCMNDHSYNPITQEHKIIIRGIESCQPLDEPNHLVYCCYTDNCNRYAPKITYRSSGDLMSSSQNHISSIMLIGITMIFQYFSSN